MSSTIPPQQNALVLSSLETGLTLQKIPTPTPAPGSAIIQVLSAGIISYLREAYNGKRGLQFPLPLVGGVNAIGRVVAVGHDATLLKPGQLVYVDCVIRGRDDQNATFLSALHQGASEGSKKLMREVWRDGPFQKYMKAPLENCFALDEERLCRTLGYGVEDLMYIGYLIVPWGGLRDINVETGETVVIAPATGGFGGAAVQVAVAMGARVIAMGRNEGELKRLKGHVEGGSPGAEIEIVKISGDEAKDTAALKAFGPIDAVLDFTPPTAVGATHLKCAISALRPKGRVSLMGFADISASMWHIVGSCITLKGKLMYSRDDILHFVKMLERARFPTGKKLVDTKTFSFEQCKEALDVAAEHTGVGRSVVFKP